MEELEGKRVVAWGCRLSHEPLSIATLSLGIGLLTPIGYAVLTVVMALSVSHTRKVYSFYVWFTLEWFKHLRFKLVPVTMKYINKPMGHTLDSNNLWLNVKT